VGILTLYYDTATSWRSRGMAVLPPKQGQGIGAALVAEAVSELGQLGATEVWCNARLTVIDFYERFGWATEGDEFQIPGVGAHVMRYQLK